MNGGNFGHSVLCVPFILFKITLPTTLGCLRQGQNGQKGRNGRKGRTGQKFPAVAIRYHGPFHRSRFGSRSTARGALCCQREAEAEA